MTSFNCFKIRDVDNLITEPIKANDSSGIIHQATEITDLQHNESNQSVNSTSMVTSSSTATTITTTANCQNSQSNIKMGIPNSYASYSRGTHHLIRCKPHFRQASFSSSAFGICMPNNKRESSNSISSSSNNNNNKEKASTISSASAQFSRNCFGHYPNRLRKHLETNVTRSDTSSSSGCFPVVVQSNAEVIYTTSGSINGGSGLVRSQSDSTCLSLKAITGDGNCVDIGKDQQVGKQINIVHDSTNNKSNSNRVNSLSDESAQSSNVSSWEMNNSNSLNESNLIDKYNLEINNKCTSLLPSLLNSLSPTSSVHVKYTKPNRTEEVGRETEDFENDRQNQNDMLASFMRNSTTGSTPSTGFTPDPCNYYSPSIRLSESAYPQQQQKVKLKSLTTPNSLSTPTTPSRSYQLICRNGVQSYTLVTEKRTRSSASPENIDFVDHSSESSTCLHDPRSPNCCPSNIANSDNIRLVNDGQSVYTDHLINQHLCDTVTPGYLTKSYENTNYSGLENSSYPTDTHIQSLHQYHASLKSDNAINPCSVISTSKVSSTHPFQLDEIGTSSVINASHSSRCPPLYSNSFDISNSNNTTTNNKTFGLHSENIDKYCQVNQSSTTDKPTAPLPSRKQRPLSPSSPVASITTGITTPASIINMHQHHTNINSVDHHQQQQQQQLFTPKLPHHTSIPHGNPSMKSLTPAHAHCQEVYQYQNTNKSTSGWSSSSGGSSAGGGGGGRTTTANNNDHNKSDYYPATNSDQFIVGTSGDGIINYYSNNYIHKTNVSSTVATTTTNNIVSSIGFVNYNNSAGGGSSDLSIPNSPHRSPRNINSQNPVGQSTTEQPVFHAAVCATPTGGGLQASVSVHCSSNLLLKSSSTSVPSTTTTTTTIYSGNADPTLLNKMPLTSSRIVNNPCAAPTTMTPGNQKYSNLSSHPPPPPLPQHHLQNQQQQQQQQQEKTVEVMIDDPANEMTISELRSIAERQRQQLARQAQQLQAREERRAWLRSLNSQRTALNKCAENEKVSNNKSSDLSQEQEIRLHKLRGFRGQTEQVRLSNENLVKEIDRLASLLSNKERDLQVCRQRADEAERMLTLISQWHNVIASARRQTVVNQTGTTPGTSETPSSSPPLNLPFMQPPFFTELDKKRWHDGLVEADRLDRQFAVAFGRKPPIQTWSSSQSNINFSGTQILDKKSTSSSSAVAASSSSTSHVSCSLAPVAVTSVPPPSYSSCHQAYSKSRLIDQSLSVHDGRSVPGAQPPHIPICQSTPVVSRTTNTVMSTTTTTTANTSFSSLLTRASSPPTSSRRTCLRTFMQLHPGFNVWSPNTTTTSNNISQDNMISPAPIHPLPIPRIKAPPRYASRAVINDTYMRRICRDSVEKYKRTASEIYLASVNKLGVKSPPLPLQQSPTPMAPSLVSSEWSNSSVVSDNQQTSPMTTTTLNDRTVKKIEPVNRTSQDTRDIHQRDSSYTSNPQYVTKTSNITAVTNDNINNNKIPDYSAQKVQSTTEVPLSSSPSASSSSSLELIGIDIQPDDEQKLSLSPTELDSPEDDQKQQNSGDVDSGLGGSDHTIKSEHHHHHHQQQQKQQPQVKKSSSTLQLTSLVTTSETKLVNSTTISSTAVIQRGESKMKDVSPGTVVYVDEGHGTDASTINTSANLIEKQQIKPILRKPKLFQSPLTSKQSPSLDGVTETTQSLSSSPCQSNSVRFHPLALLLDAALEGDLELVKKAASEVVDVSESNDEGITALHNAVCAGRVDVAEFLVLTAGADVNAGDTDGWTPLHCAASCGNLPLAKLLVEHGASLHARTLSDQETPLEKCDQGDEEAECEEYLYFQHERLGSASSGRVYALFPRGIEAAGPGSIDAHLEADELPMKPNEVLTIINREPPGEIEWMLAENSEGQRV
uniref:ANK_REP_REGION domain-containing protein n=1 Tax=Trichobilharzia regenti TaxID=157069 RepID=A0AA85K5Q7_TRIRE|nr:unnamed protein product [Trichobilharzia regenti]